MLEYLYIDTETTGLDPDRHEIWEVGAIEENGREHHWFLPVENLQNADPFALDVGQFWQRYPKDYLNSIWDIDTVSLSPRYLLDRFAYQFFDLSQNKVLVGAVPSFDEERLRKFLHRHHLIHGWHYHLLDIESMSLGYMQGVANQDVPTPWKYDVVKEFFRGQQNNDGEEFNPDDPWYAKHTALGDARLVRALHRIMRESKTL